MLPSFCTDCVTITRPARILQRGSNVLDWDDATSHEIDGCSLQKGTSSLTFDGHVIATADDATLYAPQGADVQAADRVTFDGATYYVNGNPSTKRSATGAVSHVEVALKLWEA